MFFMLFSLSIIGDYSLAAEKVYKNIYTSFHVDPLLAWKVSFAIVK